MQKNAAYVVMFYNVVLLYYSDGKHFISLY